MLAAQIFNDLQLRDIFGARCLHPARVHSAVILSRSLLTAEPVLMIQGESRDGEKQEDAEARHREIDMQPARPRRKLALPLGLDTGFFVVGWRIGAPPETVPQQSLDAIPIA
jgi:hypothetical protein